MAEHCLEVLEQIFYTVELTCQILGQLISFPRAYIILCGNKLKNVETLNRNCRKFFSVNILARNVGYSLYSYITCD